MRIGYVALSLAVTLGIAWADPLPNLVVNGGFETGSFSGWTVTGNTTPCLFVGTTNDPRCIPTTGIGPHSGNYAAELGNAGGDAFLSQNLATTAGTTYELTFWLAVQNYGTPLNDFSVTWNGKQIFSETNITSQGYTEYEFTGLAATGNSTALTFGFRDDPSYLVLDDVSVVDPPSTPEPGTLGLFGAPLVLALLRPRRSWAATVARWLKE